MTLSVKLSRFSRLNVILYYGSFFIFLAVLYRNVVIVSSNWGLMGPFVKLYLSLNIAGY